MDSAMDFEMDFGTGCCLGDRVVEGARKDTDGLSREHHVH